MVLTTKQEQALKIAIERFKNNEPYTCISGYAGAGKSTLIKFIISALGLNPEKEVAYCAFTGKAANVLKNKGCVGATTIHKLIYQAYQLKDGSFSYRLKQKLDEPYKIIVIDEISMVSQDLWEKLLSFKIHLLVTGDPEQLPPVMAEPNKVLQKPHIFLDEIMRQAQESEIIRLSMAIRNNQSLSPIKLNEIQIIDKDKLNTGMLLWADQILCATNNTRIGINNQVRSLLGRGEVPEAEDKVISLHNHWQVCANNTYMPLTNGTIGNLRAPDKRYIKLPFYISDKSIAYLFTNFYTEEGDIFQNLPIDYEQLANGNKTLSARQEYLLNKNKTFPYSAPMDFTYAYAITTHKAQGSEWSKVLVLEEGFPFNKEEHRRWLYTSVTRAKEKLVLIRNFN